MLKVKVIILFQKFWRHIVINHFKALSKATSKEMQTLIIHSDYVSRTFFNNENFSTLEDINFIKEEIKFDSFYRHKNMSYQESLSYNITAAIYFARKKHLLKDNYENIYKKFYEDFSDSIKINQYNINQHLMYSLNELDKIDFLLNKKNENINILEFGAGYGRTANAILSTKKSKIYYCGYTSFFICFNTSI